MPSTKSKLIKLRERAMKRKNDPKLRHIPSEYDIKITNENTCIMYQLQYPTIK